MATINVPGDQPTIQAGINAANPGDTVLVQPNTYMEEITIDKSLTLVSSAGAATTIIYPGPLVYYMVSIEADDVILDGFTITNPDYVGNADASGVLTYNAGRKSNIRITNCIIHDIGSMLRLSASFGTYGINSGPVDGLEVDHNIIYNIGNTDGTDSEAVGIFVWGNDNVESAVNINIHDNQVYNIINPTDDNSGIRTGGYTSDVNIESNTISPIIKEGIVTSPNMIGPVTITGNTIDGALIYGLLLRSPFLQTVTQNTIKNSVTGIDIAVGSSAPQINYNNIFGNSIGLHNESTHNVNAINNWWGSINGPNTPGADTLVGPANYTPWLQTPYPPPVRGISFW